MSDEKHDFTDCHGMLGRAELLKKYHRTQLNSLLAHIINWRLLKDKGENEIVAEVPTPIPGNEGHQTLRRVTVKQQRDVLQKYIGDSRDTLKVIEGLLQEEGVVVTEGTSVEWIAKYENTYE